MGVEISTFSKFYLNISEEAVLTATIHTFEQIFIPIYNSKGPGKVVEKKKTKKQGVVLRFDYFLKVSQISCFHYTSVFSQRCKTSLIHFLFFLERCVVKPMRYISCAKLFVFNGKYPI